MATAWDIAAFPAPGQLMDVRHYTLHNYRMGQGNSTDVLDSLGDGSSTHRAVACTNLKNPSPGLPQTHLQTHHTSEPTG
jgi:hypothetical protein